MPVINVNGWLLTVPRYRGPSYAERKEQRISSGMLSKSTTYNLTVSGEVGAKETARLIQKLTVDLEMLKADEERAIAERREYLRKRWIFASAQAEKYANISRSRVRQRDYASAKFYQHQAAQWAWEAHRLQASWAVCKFGVTMSKLVERGEYGAFERHPFRPALERLMQNATDGGTSPFE